MDNLAHTLAGAALGEAGLRQKSRLALPTLMLAANLPDIDILALAFGENLAFRRGLTHGPLGLALLPPLLVAAMWLFARLRDRDGREREGPPLRPGWLLALAYLGILTHPLMDWLNVYGIRCLAPFSDRWFYGDTLFIIDIWLWVILAAGIAVSRVRRRRSHARPGRPARISIGALVLYVVAMGGMSGAAERATAAAIAAREGAAPDLVVASPPPIDPFLREMIWRADDRIGFGLWRPWTGAALLPGTVPDHMDRPAVARAAARSDEAADFLFWARLPMAEIETDGAGARVTLRDARYLDPSGSGIFTVVVELPVGRAAPRR